MNMKPENRRDFLQQLATVTGGVALMPIVTSCSSSKSGSNAADAPKSASSAPAAQGNAVPLTPPDNWDAIAFNRVRGNAGAIPESYLPSINGPDGPMKHLGKHLPYVPSIEAAVPAGMIALMWGDPSKGYTRHPNAPRSPDNNNEGHWYNWIKIRKAVAGDAEEITSEYPEWPGTTEQQAEHYVVAGGGDITAEAGKNTVYVAKMPAGLQSGDVIRIYAHCLTHGEYVDFLTLV